MLRSDVVYKTNTSGVKGVYYSKKRDKWIAQIMFQQKCYYLGGYDRIEDAAEARAEAEEKIFGDFQRWYYDEFPEIRDKKMKKKTDDSEVVVWNESKEENVQQENVIEPSALQSLPAPEPDPEWKENEQNEQAQSFSQKKIYAEVEERIKQALLTGETQVSVVDLQIPVEANLNSLLFYSPYLSNGIDASFYYSPSECYTRIRLQNTM